MTRLSIRAYVFAISLALSIAPTLPALAQGRAAPAKETAASVEAARMKRDADAMMDQDKYVDAITLYTKAYELSGDPALLYNQGRALQALGEYPEAIDKLEKFDSEAPAALRAKVPGLHELIADLKNRITTLVVTTNAPGARLLIREKAAGTVDRETRVRTRAGPATIEIVAEGYETRRQEVELPGGGTYPLKANLVPKNKDALVVVRATPNADVALDGKAIGRSPLEIRIAPGSYTLTAHADGHEDERIPMTVAIGDRREIDLELRKPPPITAKWWFWTGIGAVLAGSVATYFLLTTERSPRSGSFSPGNVAGP